MQTYPVPSRNKIHGRSDGRNLELYKVLYRSALENGEVLPLKQKDSIPVQEAGKSKKILIRKKSTAKYVGYVLATGRKDL